MANINDGYDVKVALNTLTNMIKKQDNSDFGWKVTWGEDSDRFQKKQEHVIGILGDKDKGKTYVLSKICQEDLTHQTSQGIFGKVLNVSKGVFDNLIVFLNSQGIVFPPSKIEDGNKEKVFTDLFIYSFLLEKTNGLIIVVEEITDSEYKMIKQIIEGSLKWTKIFVIHNLKNFEGKEKIEEYIENVLKKKFSLAEEKSFKLNGVRKEIGTGSIFKEGNCHKNKYQYTAHEKEITHLVIGKEGSSGSFYNNIAFEYLKEKIVENQKLEEFEIIRELKDYYSFKTFEFLKKKVLSENIVIEKDLIYVNQTEPLAVRNCSLDKEGNFEIIEENNKNTPPFSYYKDNANFIVSVELPGGKESNEISSFDIKMECGYYKIIIKGKKLNVSDDKGEFIINILLSAMDFGLIDKSEDSEPIWTKENGVDVAKLTFDLEEDTEETFEF